MDANLTDAPLRVALLTDDFYPESGGVARSVELQLTELAAMGHRPVLVAPTTHLIPPAVGELEAVGVLRLPRTPSYVNSLQVHAAVVDRLARHPFDVVHSQNERGSMVLGARLARRLGVPHVHTFHSNYAGTHATAPVESATNSTLYLPLVPLFLRAATGRRAAPRVHRPSRQPGESGLEPWDWLNMARMARQFDAFTSPAAFVVDSIIGASGGALAGRGHVVPSGVSSRFAEARRRRPYTPPVRFISVSRLGPEKRVDQVVRAFALLDDPDSELVIIGAGPEMGRLRALARQGGRGRVEFLGHLDDVDRVAGEIADADAFVLASHRFDTQGLVLAEAASAGTPILYCDERLHVGVSDANALLVDPSAEALAAGMRRLADDAPRRRAMGAASRALAPALTTRAMGRRYVEVYRRAIAAGPAR